MHRITTAAVIGALVVPAASSTAGGAAGAASDSVLATYHGRTISLARSWEGANACAVLDIHDVRCFDSEDEMRDALVASARRAGPLGLAAASLTCTSPGTFVTLYANISMGTPALAFPPTVNWSNLAPFGFDDDMESWVNQTGCAATVAENTAGGGALLSLAARSSSSNVGTTWKNRASSIRVLP